METIKVTLGTTAPLTREQGMMIMRELRRERDNLNIRARILHEEIEQNKNKLKEASPMRRTLKLPESYTGKDLKQLKKIEKYISMRRTK